MVLTGAGEENTLSGKVAVVTGGGRNIGRAIALKMAAAGANIVVAGRNIDPLKSVASEVESMGREALPLVCDVSKKRQVENMVQSALQRLGRIDILVNNAGIFEKWKRAEEESEEVWDEVVNVNLKGPFLCSMEAGRAMIGQGGGCIVNISSAAAVAHMPVPAYTVTKAGLIALTRVLAAEWAKYNIRVNAIAPGYVEVPGWSLKEIDASAAKAILNRTPMKRTGKPEEIAEVALFLASPKSSYITGETVFVEGGWLTVPFEY